MNSSAKMAVPKQFILRVLIAQKKIGKIGKIQGRNLPNSKKRQ
jgi:hypothetical protein